LQKVERSRATHSCECTVIVRTRPPIKQPAVLCQSVTHKTAHQNTCTQILFKSGYLPVSCIRVHAWEKVATLCPAYNH
jgi:hypothetical protein